MCMLYMDMKVYVCVCVCDAWIRNLPFLYYINRLNKRKYIPIISINTIRLSWKHITSILCARKP